MKSYLMATAAAISLFGIAGSSYAGDLTLAQQIMQIKMDKCVANGTLTYDQIQGMTDADLTATLNTCAPTPTRQPVRAAAAQTVTEDAPVVFTRPARVFRQAAVTTDTDFVSQDRGVSQGGGSAPSIDIGGIGNNSNNNNNNTTTSNAGNGGNAGAGNNGAGAGGTTAPTKPVTVDNSPAARIKAMESTLNKGIANGSITSAEAAVVGGRIAALKSQASLTGTNPLAQAALARSVDTTAAILNRDLHNNVGIPDANAAAFAAKKNTLAATLTKKAQAGATPTKFGSISQAKIGQPNKIGQQTLSQKLLSTKGNLKTTAVANTGSGIVKHNTNTHLRVAAINSKLSQRGFTPKVATFQPKRVPHITASHASVSHARLSVKRVARVAHQRVASR